MFESGANADDFKDFLLFIQINAHVRGDGICKPARFIDTGQRGKHLGGHFFAQINVFFELADRRALQGIDLRVRRGGFVALVGPSGCGKSTMLKLISGLRMPSAGGVLVAGREVDRPLKIVGMAFQSPALLPWRTSLANVLLPLEIVEPHCHTFRRDLPRHKERALSLFQKVGLRNVADRFVLGLFGERLTQTHGAGGNNNNGGVPTLPRGLPQQVESFERAVIVEELRRQRGDQPATAAALGIARQTLHDKVRKLGLTVDEFK